MISWTTDTGLNCKHFTNLRTKKSNLGKHEFVTLWEILSMVTLKEYHFRDEIFSLLFLILNRCNHNYLF